MTTAPTEDAPARVRPFADILRDLKRGEVIDEAALLLQDLVRAVQTNGKKGTFTLKVDISPMKGDSNALVVAAQASINPPKGSPAEAVFFADDDHNLVRDDPRQVALPGLRRVDIDNPIVKEIAK